MLRVIFYPKAYDAIEGFSDFRMAYFERVYSDTGIFGEELILERYREESKDLVRIFVRAIEHDITRGIFGNIYEVRESEEFSRLVIKTGSNVLIVWLKRDRVSETVFVEDIEIRT